MINILDILMGENDAGALTVRDYLKALLRRLWLEQEGFSGKRPFGNSGWEDEDGWIEAIGTEPRPANKAWQGPERDSVAIS